MIRLIKTVSLLLAISLFVACNKDNYEPEELITENLVVVINQGNFTEHSASISLYDEVKESIKNRAFEEANGYSIGATIVSGAVAPNSQAILVCNYPDKIEIIDAKTAVAQSSPIVEGLANPRVAIATDSRLYVTNWGYDYEEGDDGFWYYPDSYLAIYDLSTKKLLKRVMVGTDAEGLTLYGNNLFIATAQGVKVFQLVGDEATHRATIPSSGPAKHLVFDKSLKLWASVPGEGLVRIDPSSLEVIKRVSIPIDAMDGFITTDYKTGKLYSYYTQFDENYMPQSSIIYSIDSESGDYTQLFEGNYFYGVGVSPSTGNIYGAEVNFSSNSLMKIITPTGLLHKSVTTGVGTCRFLFF